MSDYTLTELLDLAKFRANRAHEFYDGFNDFTTWEDLPPAVQLASAAALDKLLDEIEARKKGTSDREDAIKFWYDRVNPWREFYTRPTIKNGSLIGSLPKTSEIKFTFPDVDEDLKNLVFGLPVNTDGPWAKWDEVPIGTEYDFDGGGHGYWYVNRIENGVKVRKMVNVVGEMSSDARDIDSVNQPGYFTKRVPEPRTWSRLSDIPSDVTVTDEDGDFWQHDSIANNHRMRISDEDSWNHWVPTQIEDQDDIYGPFTEVLA